MKDGWWLRVGLLALMLGLALAKYKSPTVHVYTRSPVTYGEKNQVVCLADAFHPPRIEIKLKENGVVIEDCDQSDLTFNQDWSYHKTFFCNIIPREGAVYECEVTHDEKTPKNYQLEALM